MSTPPNVYIYIYINVTHEGNYYFFFASTAIKSFNTIKRDSGVRHGDCIFMRAYVERRQDIDGTNQLNCSRGAHCGQSHPISRTKLSLAPRIAPSGGAVKERKRERKRKTTTRLIRPIKRAALLAYQMQLIRRECFFLSFFFWLAAFSLGAFSEHIKRGNQIELFSAR